MAGALAGTRIREVRRRAGLSQTALARAAGISPSYLNLIEHNRRAAAGKVLIAIAEALGTRPADLSDSGEAGLLSELREAVAPNTPSEPPEAFIGRFPYWARQLARLFRQTRDQGQAIAALSDRLTHDPYLSENIHGMLSNITAIRSTASILSAAEDMPEDQRHGFHETIHAESVRLSAVAEGLATYLGSATGSAHHPVTPEEAFDQFLFRHDYRFDALDRMTEIGAATASTVVEIAEHTKRLVADPDLPEGAARQMAHSWLTTYASDAMDLPLTRFYGEARERNFDPVALSQSTGKPIPTIMRRLAVLKRPGLEMPQFGLIAATASGHPLFRRPLPDFPMPRHGNACTLWPLFAALSQPERPLLAQLVQDTGQRFVTVSVARPHGTTGLNALPDLRSSMLVVAETESPFAAPPMRVETGTSCRLCTRTTCPSRSESPILGTVMQGRG